jgi:cell fate regulator YaaT (PSP1 superfamily)
MRGVFARFEADAGEVRCSSGSVTAADFAKTGKMIARRFTMKARKPWQDRRMLLRFAACPQPTASRRLAHGFHSFAKTMKDDRNVRYPSC